MNKREEKLRETRLAILDAVSKLKNIDEVVEMTINDDNTITCVAKLESERIDRINDYADAYHYLDDNDECSFEPILICKDNKKSLVALDRLRTIAKAWNEIDGFEPSFSDVEQARYYPVFDIDIDCNFSFNCSLLENRKTSPFPAFFRTDKIAEQFGRQFLDLYKDYILG